MTIAVAIGVGLVIGLSLGMLGGGGSILTVPALVYLMGQSPQAATTAAAGSGGASGWCSARPASPRASSGRR